MKKIKYILGFIAIAMLFTACSEDYERSTGGNVIAINPVLNEVVDNQFLANQLSQDGDGDFLYRLSWSAPRISYSNGLPADVSELSYSVQAGLLGSSFDKYEVLSETNNLFFDLFSAKLYNVAQKLNENEIEDDVYVEIRVVASYSGAEESLLSNSITTTVLFETEGEGKEPEVEEEVVIRFKQTVGDWAEFAVYAWGDAEVYGGWPGLTLEADADGWYTLTVPENRPVNLIINNNGAGDQFDFLTDPESSACYEFDTDDKIFTTVDCPVMPITIRWRYVGEEWETIGMYAWGGNPEGDTFGGWPGVIGEPDADGWCTTTIPADQSVGNVIFNNGEGGEGGQFDADISITGDICIEFDSSSFQVVECE